MKLQALGQLVQRFRWSRKGKSARVSSAAVSAPGHRSFKDSERDDEQRCFVHAIQRMVKDNPVLRSHVYIISLADFRQTVASKWSRLADKVMLLTRAIIRKHMDKVSLLAQADDDTFVLAMPVLDRLEARRRIARMASDLSSALVGDQVLSGQRPAAVTANLPFENVVDREGKLDLAAIHEAVHRARAVIAAAVTVGAQGKAETAGAEETRIPRPANDQPTGERWAWRNGEWVDFSPGTRKAASAWSCFHFGALEASSLSSGEDVPPLPEGAKLSVFWRPTWVSANDGVAAFWARPYRVDSEAVPPREGHGAYPTGSAAGILAIDRYLANAVAGILKRQAADLGRACMVLPLSWPSLDSKNRWLVTGCLTDLPVVLRRETVKIELFRIPAEAPLDEIRDVVQFLRGLGGDVLVRLNARSAPVGLMAKSGAAMVGLDLAELRSDEQMPDDDLLANLARFCRMAARNKVGCYLSGIRRRRVLGGAIAGGFDMVNGPALMNDQGKPGAVMAFSRDRLIRLA